MVILARGRRTIQKGGKVQGLGCRKLGALKGIHLLHGSAKQPSAFPENYTRVLTACFFPCCATSGSYAKAAAGATYLLLSEALQEVVKALWVESADRPGQISAAKNHGKSSAISRL